MVSHADKDRIVELVYDPCHRETHLAFLQSDGTWSVEDEVTIEGECFVPYSATNNLIATDCILLPSQPVAFGTKHELVEEIVSYLRRYVDLDPVFERIAAHYALLSWVYDAFNELPYLRLQGDFGSGKTRGLITIGSILYRPFFASGASTVSPIFHILDTCRATLVLDEADFRFTDATNELVKILNNGTMRGLPVLRTMQNRNRELNPRAFRVFGAKIVAMRGAYSDPGLESRFLSADMNKRQLRADIPIHLPDALREEARELRNKLLAFRFSARFSTRIDPDLVSREDDPRVNQIALPLLSVMDDPELRREVRQLLRAQSVSIPRGGDREAIAREVLTVILDAFQEPEVQSVAVGKIAREVNARMNGRYTSKYVGRVIRKGFGIETHKSMGLFVVTRDALPVIEQHADKLRRV